MDDQYKSIAENSEETLFKDRGSKFYGYAFPVSSEDNVKKILEELKEKHSGARHFCYAYQLGVDALRYRVNDDGEPNNSAGMPIYGQIQSFELTNVLVVSVRYFGGTKLGLGGLINAYRTSAKLALEASQIVTKTLNIQIKITFPYDLMNKVMRIIKEYNLEILSQKMELNCQYILSVRKTESENVIEYFTAFFGVTIQKLNS